LLFSVAYGQLDISRPISFQTDLLTPIPIYTTPEVDVRELLMEDSIQAVEGFKPNRVGQSFSTNITPNNTGRWETIENVKVWRVRLISNNAYSLKVTLSNFELPKNASLFAYSEDGTFLMGPFTANYNVESRVLPIPLIPGEAVGREVFRKKTVLSKGGNTLKLNIAHLQSGMYYLKVMDSEGRFLSETIMKM
jgi:hypothetical protein